LGLSIYATFHYRFDQRHVAELFYVTPDKQPRRDKVPVTSTQAAVSLQSVENESEVATQAGVIQLGHWEDA